MGALDLLTNFLHSLNPIGIFGIIMLIGLMSGELAKKIPYLPKISAYILIGFLLGPGGLNIFNNSLLADIQIFIIIALGIILFELGKQLDFAWLFNDKQLLLMSLAETTLTFFGIFSLLHWYLQFSSLMSALAATITIATSPAVIMMIIHDIVAEGPTTRRAMILTSLNNLVALTLFAILLPLTKIGHMPIAEITTYFSSRLFGSISIALTAFILMLITAKLIGKNHENQRVLFLATIITITGLTLPFQYSPLLCAFMLGAAMRNFDRYSLLIEIEFGWLTRMFSILLFVVMGANLQISSLWYMPILVFIFVGFRSICKLGGIVLGSARSQLTNKQVIAIGLTLLPMADVAIGMSTRVMAFNPEIGHQLLFIIAGSITLLNLISPIITQYAFNIVGESNQEKSNERG